MRYADPVDGSLYFHVGVLSAAPAAWDIGTLQLRYIPIRVFYHFIALDDIGAFQPDLLSGREAEEFLGRVLHKIVPLDIYFPAEGHISFAGFGVFRVVLALYDLFAVRK